MLNLIKWILLVILFAPVLYLAFREKKWYLYLACAFVGILPDNFAVELSASLPLLTAQRILILVLMGFWLVRQWKRKKWKIPMILVAYFTAHWIIAVCNLQYGLSGEVKRMAILALEQILLIIMITDTISTRAEFDRCIDVMLLSCAALAAIGICQTVFDFDVTSVLQVVTSRSDMELTPRMDMTRAFGMSNAIIYGCYCAMMTLLCYYRMERTGRQRYSVILTLNILALLCTMSRSAWLCFAGLVALLVATRPKKFFNRSWICILLVIVLFCGMVFLNGNFGRAMLETGKSSLNTVLKTMGIEIPGFNVSNSTGANKLAVSGDFGLNESSATRSRIVEWSAVKYMTQEGRLLFGYGYNAFPRGMLHYFYPQFGFWTVATTLDVGLLAIITETGLVGLLAELALLGYMVFIAIKNRGRKGLLTYNKLTLYVVVAYLLLNFMAAFTGPVWVIFALFFAHNKLEDRGASEDWETEQKTTLAF